jgi:hypothetical protein
VGIGNTPVAAVSATTFNGIAQAELRSQNRQTGTATVTVSLGTTSGSAEVEFEPAAVIGTLSLGFGTSGTGAGTKTGSANQNDPLDETVGVTAEDLDGDPIAGATVRFRIVQDTTDEGSPNEPAHFLTSDTTSTGGSGTAVNILRVYGAGVIAIEADLIDPVTGETVATSNRIILTTTAAEALKLAFNNGLATFTGNAPFNVGIVARLFDETGAALGGRLVRFTIQSDNTGGASLSVTTGTTDGNGRTTTSLHVPSVGGGETVTVKAALYDANGTEITSATVTANGS